MTLHSFRLWLPFLECLRQKKVDTTIQTLLKTSRLLIEKDAAVLNGLIWPSDLIIDETGLCEFDKENIQLFFDLVDRRFNEDNALPRTQDQAFMLPSKAKATAVYAW